jgi:hypothetical protein
MSNLENYEAKLAVITAIPEDQIITAVNIPVETYVQEGEKLYRWCQEDQAALTARGLDWTLVDDLPVRIGALMEAESRWIAQRFVRKEAGDQWSEENPELYELRNTILHEFRFAYRENEWLSGRVSEISEGSGHADMLQDLNDLAVLGKENPDLLTTVNFDMTLLDKAAQAADEKSTLWAEASYDRAGYKEAKKIRDQTYTHLKEAVDKIREYGQFVFWRNDARLQGYRSEYLYRRNKKRESVENNTNDGQTDANTNNDNEENTDIL